MDQCLLVRFEDDIVGMRDFPMVQRTKAVDWPVRPPAPLTPAHVAICALVKQTGVEYVGA
ncbi:hypothetical protein EFB14_23065 [Rhizobium fabae]|uniref:IS66 family insertion sequence transposase domain-containing protein n=1 Tax=Rhizobium fabae TaxID=573179 RepID=A0ABY0B577_9HYPH|nr:hypothetical protein EFB14_23065 [Rhizobium fabae]